VLVSAVEAGVADDEAVSVGCSAGAEAVCVDSDDRCAWVSAGASLEVEVVDDEAGTASAADAVALLVAEASCP